jgi:hypothetical protein
LRVNWTIKNGRDSENQGIPHFDYSVIITKSTNAIVVYANPTHTPQRWSGRGSCQIRQNAKLPKTLG